MYEKFIDAPKEIRMLWFYNDGAVEWKPILRLTEMEDHGPGQPRTSTDEYCFIKDDSVPETIVDGTKQILTKMSEQSGKKFMSGAIDFTYAKSVFDSQPRWYVMEGNFWQPVPPSREENKEMREWFVKETIHNLLAAMANGKTEVTHA
jgi:hypothetical protein